MPIIAISGKTEPMAVFDNSFQGLMNGDLNLGSSELDVAAALNENVEAYIALAYDSAPPSVGPRIDNSAFNLNMGFVNIGNLDKTPFYFTAGQLYVPFGRYSSAMISAPLTMNLARTKTRPFIVGYKSQEDTGPFVALYGYRSDTTYGKSGVVVLIGAIFLITAILMVRSVSALLVLSMMLPACKVLALPLVVILLVALALIPMVTSTWQKYLQLMCIPTLVLIGI